MNQGTLFKEDLELLELQETAQKARLREKECAEMARRLAMEIKDRENTMPPLKEVQERKILKEHEAIVSRGEVANVVRVQTRSLLLLVMLIAATSTLIWWGLKLMQG